MTTNNLHSVTARLDRVFEVADNINDDEIKSHLARYLCVLTSGYLEETIKILTRNYVVTKASPLVANYVDLSINKITNLNSEKIEKFLNSFNNKWKEEFNKCITVEEKDAIDSVVANRHQIAHGRNVGVSYVNIKQWHTEINHVVIKLKHIIS